MRKKISLKKLFPIAIAATCMGVSSAALATIGIAAVPTAWRLQNYEGQNAVLWFTGSVCPNGQLTLDPADTPERNKMLYATIMAAKASKLKVVIQYDAGVNVCFIRNFGLDSQ